MTGFTPWELIVWSAAGGVAVLFVGTPMMLLLSALDRNKARHQVETEKEMRELR